MEKISVVCPFCENKIDVLFIESTVSSKIQRNSTSKKRVTTVSQEKYQALEDCSNCGKSKKEIQKALQEGTSKPKSKEELKKQLEELGLSGKL